MKKRTVDYKNEPSGEGWHFDPSAKPLDGKAALALGIPAPVAPGTEYERTEKGGMVMVKPVRGGKRAGAGRKPTGNVRLQLLVPAEAREKLVNLAKRDRVTLSEAFRRTITAYPLAKP